MWYVRMLYRNAYPYDLYIKIQVGGAATSVFVNTDSTLYLISFLLK